MLWMYDLSNWQLCTLIVGGFVGGSLIGLALVRPWIKRHCTTRADAHNEAVSAFIGTYGVFYGITLGLIAVATWEKFEAADEVVEQEAAALAVLYRDVGALPEPRSTKLRDWLREYLDFVLDVAWKQHRQGKIPLRALKLAAAFEKELMSFEPTTMREEVVFREALDRYNEMLAHRKNRMDAVEGSLPDVLWWVVLIGAALNIALVYLIDIDPPLTQYLLTALLAAFLGLMVFLVVALDHPFRGELTVDPRPFEQLREVWNALDAAGLE